MIAFEDPDHAGNGPEHHTGEPCVEQGCERPAGTWWSPLWCHECNVVRMRRISRNLEGILADLEAS